MEEKTTVEFIPVAPSYTRPKQPDYEKWLFTAWLVGITIAFLIVTL